MSEVNRCAPVSCCFHDAELDGALDRVCCHCGFRAAAEYREHGEFHPRADDMAKRGVWEAIEIFKDEDCSINRAAVNNALDKLCRISARKGDCDG